MKLTDLKPAGYNPRTITDEQLARLKKALQEFGDLSGIVYNRRAGDVVGAIALGNNCAHPDKETWPLLKESACILNALDYDQGGASQIKWWQAHFPQCKRWPVPEGKDPGDYYKTGGSIGEWILAGLPQEVCKPPHQS